jgi:hypothetical protein
MDTAPPAPARPAPVAPPPAAPPAPAPAAAVAVPDQFALGAPTVKSCGGPVMAHNTNTKIFLKRAGRGRKKAVLQHSPFMPYGDCEFSITAAGVVDAVDG